MAAELGLPKWLLDAKEQITRSKDWDLFIEELYDAVQQQLKESHVQTFTDLTAPERQLFMERAAKAIHGGRAYGDLYDKVSESLDKNLNNEVARELLEDYPINTKTDLILEAAQDGVIALLRRWPDMKPKLHIYFNQPLPKSLRQLAWKLFLENTKVRKRYVDLLTNNPRAAISQLDFEISQKCEHLLLSEPTFSELKGSVGAFYGMKAVLSFHHSSLKTHFALPDADFFLVVPFVLVAHSSMSRREPAANHVVALMVEEYFTFLESRPRYMVESNSDEHDDELMAFCGKIANLIQHLSPATGQALSSVFVSANAEQSSPMPSHKSSSPVSPKASNNPDSVNANNSNNEGPVNEHDKNSDIIVTGETGHHALLSEILISAVKPIIRSLFVGYVNVDVLLFIWDQYIIGIDAPGFHEEYLPAVVAIFFMLLKDEITKCHSAGELEMVLKTEGATLKVPQFQYELKRHFGSELKKVLSQDEKAALPVLDPTQANYRPWVYWFSDNMPSRITPQDRRRARDERAAERERLLQQQREEQMRLKAEEDKRRYEEEQHFKEQQALERQRQYEERMKLEDQLEMERRKRIEAERNAEAEIERLKMEIEELRRMKLRSQESIHSLDSAISQYLIPPPPTPASSTQIPALTPVVEPKTKTPTPQMAMPPSPPRPATKRTDDVLMELLKRFTHSFKKISHGEGNERHSLDEETRQYILEHKKDMKEAEIEVFGHILEPGEYQKLSADEQKRKSDQMMALIKHKMERRRQHKLE